MGIILRSKKIYFKTQFDVANIDGGQAPRPKLLYRLAQGGFLAQGGVLAQDRCQ